MLHLIMTRIMSKRDAVHVRGQRRSDRFALRDAVLTPMSGSKWPGPVEMRSCVHVRVYGITDTGNRGYEMLVMNPSPQYRSRVTVGTFLNHHIVLVRAVEK